MQPDNTRAVTVALNDRYVFKRHGKLEGVLIDLWHQIAEDLNIPSKLVKLETENDLYEEAKAQKADIIIQRIDRSQVYRENISASV